jgi:hypothetical protein
MAARPSKSNPAIRLIRPVVESVERLAYLPNMPISDTDTKLSQESQVDALVPDLVRESLDYSGEALGGPTLAVKIWSSPEKIWRAFVRVGFVLSGKHVHERTDIHKIYI